MKIGILGGTFDPIHNGHIEIALAAREQCKLDVTWLMPAKIPPHKQGRVLTDDLHRICMLFCAAGRYPCLSVNLLEFERNTVSYTVETLRLLRQEYPQDEFYYIMGEDSLHDFSTWYQPQEIAGLATLVVASRNPDNSSLKKIADGLRETYGANIILLKQPWNPVSSTEIRERVMCGRSFVGFVPEEVSRYISYLNLYGTGRVGQSEALEAYERSMRNVLQPKQFAHSRGVAYTALTLAIRYGADPERALIAGMLHDCAKQYSGEELLKLCGQQNIAISHAERTIPHLLHGKYGAYLAQEVYRVADSEILSAIEHHTIGREGMTLLEKIIFVADYMEPTRTHRPNPPLWEIRRQAFEDIDHCIVTIVRCVLAYLEHEQQQIDDEMYCILRYYEKEKGHE